jgi:hypothetical protein
VLPQVRWHALPASRDKAQAVRALLADAEPHVVQAWWHVRTGVEPHVVPVRWRAPTGAEPHAVQAPWRALTDAEPHAVQAPWHARTDAARCAPDALRLRLDLDALLYCWDELRLLAARLHAYLPEHFSRPPLRYRETPRAVASPLRSAGHD